MKKIKKGEEKEERKRLSVRPKNIVKLKSMEMMIVLMMIQKRKESIQQTINIRVKKANKMINLLDTNQCKRQKRKKDLKVEEKEQEEPREKGLQHSFTKTIWMLQSQHIK